MKYKNYYKILGLESSKVKENEIKIAYRKLAKKYHPDRNPGNNVAAEKFKDINEAYQVLINPEERRKYNRKHFIYSLKDVPLSFKQIIDESGSEDFIEMFFGKEKIFKNKKEEKVTKKGEDINITLELTLEEAFFGTKKVIAMKTLENKIKRIEVKIPAGIVNGGKIKIKDEGKTNKNTNIPGDLYINIRIKENEKYKIKKADMEFILNITPSQAILGDKIKIKGLDFEKNIEIPAFSKNDSEIIIRDKGYYDSNSNRGNFVVKIKIDIPNKITKEEKALYLKIKEIEDKKSN